MLVILGILLVLVFVGGVFTVCKTGQKDGICKYGQVGEEDVLQK